MHLIHMLAMLFAWTAPCEPAAEVAFFHSPYSVVAGDTVRVLAVAETETASPSSGPTALVPPGVGTRDGRALQPMVPSMEVDSASPSEPAARCAGGPPYWWTVSFVAPASGTVKVRLVADGKELACTEIQVDKKRKKRRAGIGAWRVERQWDRATENLYSAWLEHLFSVDEGTSWRSLHEVTRNPERNLLHDHLGLGEDDSTPGSLMLGPDCADNPYFLRAYFAWKVGAAFGFHRCDRGARGRAPGCTEWVSNDLAGFHGKDELRAAQRFFNAVASGVHSATARTDLASNATDLYGLPLTRDELRPGTVFADPFGHTLTLVRWIAQTETEPGVLLAVDAQPDGTVAVKRFWRGNFMFTTKDVIGSPGFKAFRPIRGNEGALKLLTNRQIRKKNGYENLSLQQKGMETTAFFDAMEVAVNPAPLDPEVAYKQIHEALHAQLLARVESVRLGEDYAATHAGAVIPMPPGIRIFLTSGPWEDFSTPSRDLRLLVAMDVLRDFPERVVRTPTAFRIPENERPAEVAVRLRTKSAEWAATYKLEYVRSDGATQVLTLADVLAREKGFEVAYNPNDCIEVRWAAPEGSDERRSCERRAPKDQTKAMEKCRAWFAERRRPAW